MFPQKLQNGFNMAQRNLYRHIYPTLVKQLSENVVELTLKTLVTLLAK